MNNPYESIRSLLLEMGDEEKKELLAELYDWELVSREKFRALLGIDEVQFQQDARDAKIQELVLMLDKVPEATINRLKNQIAHEYFDR